MAFEKQNSCRIVVTTRSCQNTERPDLWFEAKAISLATAGVVPVLLASAQCSCGQANLQTMAAAILKLLYALDFQLAQAEFAALGK